MLGRRYYRNNDYDVVKLELGRPRMYHFLTKYGLIYDSVSAAAILSDPDHAISSPEQLRSLLQTVEPSPFSHPQWTQTELPSLPPDTPFTHATILSLLSEVQASPLYYVVYIMVGHRCGGQD